MSEENENGVERPDIKVVHSAKRRRSSARYKLRIVEEADECKNQDEIGALLRREELYSSHSVKLATFA